MRDSRPEVGRDDLSAEKQVNNLGSLFMKRVSWCFATTDAGIILGARSEPVSV